MSTIAIVGAGPGVGSAVARRFGREGFAVALISRTQAHLDALAAELSADGITVQGFPADVRDRDALELAIDAATTTLGPIEVLQYSPIPTATSSSRCWTQPQPTSPQPSTSRSWGRSPRRAVCWMG